MVYATTGPARKSLCKRLRQSGLPDAVSDSGKSLGVQFQSRGRRVTSVRDQRVSVALPRLHKLKAMPWCRAKKSAVGQRTVPIHVVWMRIT